MEEASTEVGAHEALMQEELAKIERLMQNSLAEIKVTTTVPSGIYEYIKDNHLKMRGLLLKGLKYDACKENLESHRARVRYLAKRVELLSEQNHLLRMALLPPSDELPTKR